MPICRSRFFAKFLTLLPALIAPGLAHAHAAGAVGPETDWQLGVIALVAIGVAGAGVMMAGNARRRREVRAAELAARRNAARAQAAITGDDTNELQETARAIDEMTAPPPDANTFRNSPHRRQRAGGGPIGERDQNTPGTSRQRTRSQ